ncbi:UNVERIFIED_CONTAM: AAA family ATPase [Kocuria sp. CPCC 205274]
MFMVKSLSVTGLAGSTKRQEFDLNPDINIFWGLNGCGKSSLLKLISAAFRCSNKGLSEIPFKEFSAKFYDPDSNLTVERSITRDGLTVSRHGREDEDVEVDELIKRLEMLESEDSKKEWGTAVFPADAPDAEVYANRRLPYTFLPTSRFVESTGRYSFYRRTRTPEEMSDEGLARYFADEVGRRWAMYSSRSLMDVKRVQQKGMAEILQILLSGRKSKDSAQMPMSDPKQAFSLVKAFLDEQDVFMPLRIEEFTEQYSERPELQNIVTRIQNTTNEVERIQQPQNSFLSVVNNLLSSGKRIELGSADLGRPTRENMSVYVNERRIDLSSISSGERHLIQIMLITMTSEKMPVIIDEPELSLHVDWQEDLVASMRAINPTAQLILASHSPELQVGVEQSKIFRLGND